MKKKMMPDNGVLDPQWVRNEMERLAKEAAWPGCPQGGWQFPFDLGNGITARTYTPTQIELHPWRQEVLLHALKNHDLLDEATSVLDLGAGEGAMASALWDLGLRDITCVELREINVEKARFIQKVKNQHFRIEQREVADFLQQDGRRYDVVLFMGLLYHLQDPFQITRQMAKRTNICAVIETVLAIPDLVGFANVDTYKPLPAAFYIRRDNRDSQTAGLSNMELWPTREALEILLFEAGFRTLEVITHPERENVWYASGQRIMLCALK